MENFTLTFEKESKKTLGERSIFCDPPPLDHAHSFYMKEVPDKIYTSEEHFSFWNKKIKVKPVRDFTHYFYEWCHFLPEGNASVKENFARNL